LEAAELLLADGLVAPWPGTLLELATGGGESTLLAIGSLATSRDGFPVDAFDAGRPVLFGQDDNSVRTWHKATVKKRHQLGIVFWYDVVKDSSPDSCNYTEPQEKLLARSTGCAGAAAALLRAASGGGHNPLVRRLLEAGVNVFEADEMARTALHEAATAGHGDTCTQLLMAGALADVPDATGLTALVVGKKHESVRRVLCPSAFERGAPPTPLAAARWHAKATW